MLLDYVEANISGSPMLNQLITNRTQDSLTLSNKVSVVVRSSDWRRLRGFVAALCDELGFFRDESENSSNADAQILAAVRPGLATTQGPLVMFSSPHSKKGELFKIYEEHFGKDEHDVLVAHGASRDFNKTLPQAVVTRALERDPAAASAEYLAQFRTDVDTFIDRDVVLAAVSPGRFELPPLPDVSYIAFTDPAGGSGGDSFTLAICHIEGQRIVLDLVRERHPPYAPDSVVQEFSETLKSYRVSTVTGDRYASLWPRGRFAVHGITYRVADSSKSDFYLAFLPLINSGRVDLLDSKKLVSQLCALERRTARGGRESVDHPSNGHDDLINSTAGSIVTAVRRSQLKEVPIVSPIAFRPLWPTTAPGPLRSRTCCSRPNGRCRKPNNMPPPNATFVWTRRNRPTRARHVPRVKMRSSPLAASKLYKLACARVICRFTSKRRCRPIWPS